jgi:hypothetical protein
VTEKDTIPPVVQSVTVMDDFRLSVSFSEIPDENTVNVFQNYSVNNGLGNPAQVITDNSQPNIITLVFNNPILSGIQYKLTVTGVTDRAGNSRTQSIDFVYAVGPSKGDLIISEVLTDPYTGGEDFVEICNRSEKF